MKISLPNRLNVEINKNDYTANVIGCGSDITTIFIPRSFVYESHEYIITKIKKDSFNITTKVEEILFPEDSELILIEKGAISNSEMKSMMIPKSVKILEDGWCNYAKKFNRLSVSPYNANFSYLDDKHKIIVGKSDPCSTIYDIIVFANRDVRQAIIPSYIKYISSYAFSSCENLRTITFSANSELFKIGEGSFSGSTIISIEIPSSVEEIGNLCFIFCFSLKKILFDKNSKLHSIGYRVFEKTTIESILLPPKLKRIEEKSFNFCKNLQNVQFSQNCEIESIGKSAFENSSLLSINIPSSIKFIEERSFFNCRNLEIVEFSENTEIEIIEKSVFESTSIKNIKIPSKIKKIEEKAFAYCLSIEKIEFNNDSQLNSISSNAFYGSSLRSIFIPALVDDLKDGWCNFLNGLINISISPKNRFYSYFNDKMVIKKEDLNDDVYKILVFLRRDETEVLIPSFIEKIGAFSMNSCWMLEKVEFSEHSKLRVIEKFAFSESSISKIIIPDKVKLIGECAFCNCQNLKEIELTENSELEKIEENAFSHSSICKMNLPNTFCSFCVGWCCSTPLLNEIFLFKNNQNLMYLDDSQKVIIGKSDVQSEVFDVLYFACRDVEKVTIPSFIRKIGSYAFADCKLLKTVEISVDSQLNEIEEGSFYNTSIEFVYIPKSVKIIEKFAFCFCSYLNCIEFDENSELVSIGKNCFTDSFIEKLKIPKNLASIGSSSFRGCPYLNEIEIDKNSNLESIEKFTFSETSVVNVCIPKKISKLNEKVFQNCIKLMTLELLADDVVFCLSSLNYCVSFKMIAFPNANKITFLDDFYSIYSYGFTLFTCSNALILKQQKDLNF